ncbi:MAG: hypothetical protein ACTS6P_02015 [Candidatus Hodgkinia cicadicola]
MAITIGINSIRNPQCLITNGLPFGGGLLFTNVQWITFNDV